MVAARLPRVARTATLPRDPPEVLQTVPSSARRAPRPDDLHRLRIPTDPRLAPDGRSLVCTLQHVTPAHDGYRTAIWRVALEADGRAAAPAERLTLGAKHDGHARFAPNGRTLAFLSDRRTAVEDEPDAPKDREDQTQVHLLPLDRPGEARRLTDLPRGVDDFAWSPDGTRLAVISASRTTDRKAEDRARRRLPEAGPGKPPPSDYWFFDRLGYQANGAGVVAGRTAQLWVVDATTGAARRLTDLPAGVGTPAWSPDGRRIAVVTGRRRDDDLGSHARIVAVNAEDGRLTPIAEHPAGIFFAPTWMPGGRELAALGGDHPHVFYRSDIWLFRTDGSEAGAGRNLSDRHDIMPASSMNSDVTIGEDAGLWPTPDGGSLLFRAPVDGAQELWRIAVDDGELERLTSGEHGISAADTVDLGGSGIRIAAIRSTATLLPEVHVGRLTRAGRVPAEGGRRGAARSMGLAPVTSFNESLASEVELRTPLERWVEVDGHRVQGWLIPAGDGPRPTVVQIHGGPHTYYGWAPFWEFQVLAGSGMSVFYSNPRGSEGYGRDFNEGNIADWGRGPARDVLAGVDALVEDGLADPGRLGVTGGSYGGYLTSWIVAHDQRFAAAITCRSVNDLSMLMLTGDLTGTDWPKYEFGAYPWEAPDLFRDQSPLTYAANIRTPLLIQHAEQDLRTTIGQAEALFAVLRKHRRPVRLMRVPGESHELTRSGTPFRRAENLVQVRDWFAHYLVAGKRGLPPRPRTRHGH
ncbi:MAG TPA: S9 family peptidase [Candidatus Limnocylindrales bacterium]|nr:S9 family peptidase [Candidatus Limnocylindrales bacterium]